MARSRVHTALKAPASISTTFPWAHFAMNEGGGSGTGTAVTLSNDGRATTITPLNLGSALDEQWSVRPGFLTTDGLTDFAGLADAADIRSVFQVGEGAILLGMQVSLPRTSVRRTIFLAGSGLGAGTDYGYLLIAENDATNRKVLAQIRDDANNNATNYTSTTDIQDGGAAVSVSSLTRSGAVATANIAGHTMVVGDYVYIAGAAQAEYNGCHRITAIAAGTSISFPVSGTPTTPATGTITAAKHGSLFNIFLTIDNRPGVKSAVVYSQVASLLSSGAETANLALTSHGAITLAGASGNLSPGVWIGKNARSSNLTYSPMNIRRLTCINFGASGLPSNTATKIIPALQRSGMVPTFEAFDAIARGF